MAGRWVKAAFLIVLGIIILLYANEVVTELENAITDVGGTVAFDMTWDLLTWLFYILVGWLFVLAILTIAQSVTEHRYTLTDVMRRFDSLEKKLGVAPAPKPPPPEEIVETEAPVEEEVPPPP